MSEYVRLHKFTYPGLNPHYNIHQGVSIFRPIIYGNTATVLSPKERETLVSPDHTHRWTVAVRSAASAPDSDQVGGADDLSYFIKRVTFKLHDTYPTPSRGVAKFVILRDFCAKSHLQLWINLHMKSQRQGM